MNFKSALTIFHLSFLLVGVYYSYDLPAALHHALAGPFHSSDDKTKYEFQIQTLYSIYSCLNIVIPVITGSLLNRIGIKNGLLMISSLILVGQILSTMGMYLQSYPIILARGTLSLSFNMNFIIS